MLLTDPLIITAFWIGIVSAVALPLGALTSFFWTPEDRIVAAMMAFGGGALLAALSVDLVAPALDHGHLGALFIGFLGGGLLFITLNLVVNDFGGFKRKISTSVHHSRRDTHRRMERILGHLNRTAIFKGLTRQEFWELAEAVEPRFYPKGSFVYQQGDPADALYVVVKGSVSMDLPAPEPGMPVKQIDRIGNAGAFGANSLFTGSAHRFTASATEPTWLWCIPESSLRHLLSQSSAFQQSIREWLHDPNTRLYLLEEQGLSEKDTDEWLAEANQLLDAESRLPDARPVERRTEAFRDFAPKIDRVPWLEDLSEEEADWLSMHLVYRNYGPNEVLFKAGDPASRMYLLEYGQVALTDPSNQLLPSYQQAGDGVGMRSFITGVRHTLTARTVGKCGAWTLRQEDFRQLLHSNHDFQQRLLGYLKSPGLSAYLRQRYQIDGGKIHDWLSRAVKAVKSDKAPPGLLAMGVEAGAGHGAALAIWLGILLDSVPESLVIGATLTVDGISLSLIAGLFLANYPEALSSSRGMVQDKYSRLRIVLLWSSIMLLTGIGAAIGKTLVDVAPAAALPFLEGLAAGAMLTMIAQTMLPEAYIKGGSIIGLSTLLGFLAAISMKVF